MAGRRTGIAAKLGQRNDAIPLWTTFEFTEVIVDTVHISSTLVEPSTGFVDQSGVIHSLNAFCRLRGIKLSPALIKGRPKSNTGIVLKQLYHAGQIFVKLLAAPLVVSFQRPVMVVAKAPAKGGKCIWKVGHKKQIHPATAIWHILPDDYAELVAQIVKPFLLDFNMHAYGIKAKPL